jgi:shikimate dehydrogenase
LHEREAEAHGIRCVYELLDLDMQREGEGALGPLIDAAERVGFAGLNITHPCKQSVLTHLTGLSDGARDIGAVNTVVFADGTRVGHNTDWWAFRKNLEEGLPGISLDRVVQLGAGGAGAATAYAVLTMGARHLRIADTIPHRAEALCQRLAARFPGRVSAVLRNTARSTGDTDVQADDVLGAAIADADGLIHATPTGMASHPGLPIPERWLGPSLWVAEVVYFPVETPLLRAARQRDCRTVDGTGMALWQAVEAFRLFTGIKADAERMRRWFDMHEDHR